MNGSRINLPLLVLVLFAAAGLFAIGWHRITIDTDIVSSLPQDDPVISDAVHIFANHPFQNQLTIDVALDRDDPDALVDCGQAVSQALKASGLFERVGMEDLAGSLPQLMQAVADRLPVLFTAGELSRGVTPLLAPEAITRRLTALRDGLLQMDGIGQAAIISKDPLGLKDLVMAKLLLLAPTQSARVYKGQLISADGRHLLIMAVPAASGTDTAFARRLSAHLEQVAVDLQERFAARGLGLTLTPVGAYRAALDNETIVRRDVRNAIWFASIGIALLLMAAFPRPLIGLLSLLPAIVGTLVAFFVFSLIQPSISVMVLGFGGAIISITVDHGIAYLLFLDRPRQSFGRQASREVWAVGLLAVLTTVGAFGALLLSDFPVLQQLGLFTALGICFSFLFVHTIFPLIFSSLRAAGVRRLALPVIADRLFATGKSGAYAAVAVFMGMLFFVVPDFHVNLTAMNTVSPRTRDAEKRIADAWGNVFSKVFVMTEAESLPVLQEKNDRLLAAMEEESEGRLIQNVFSPSMVFPGQERRKANLADWKAFWHAGRLASVKQKIRSAGVQAGFRPDAFEPFFDRLAHPDAGLPEPGVPPAVLPLMGISRGGASSPWRQFTTLTLPPTCSEHHFYTAFGGLAHIFAPGLFSDRLGRLMARTFIRLLCMVGVAVVVLLLLFFLDVQLTLIALVPVLFAMVCTLGTLNLLGRSMDIPGLILAVVVLGMGIDYSLFMVRSYQRYGRADHPSFRLIRSSVFMTAASTLIGFGVLANADHALLHSAGITASLGIGYSVLGVFLLLPPLLKWYFETDPRTEARPSDTRARVLARYRRLETHARQFARFKIKLDPLFSELTERVAFPRPPRYLVDIGTGYGVPACWLVASYPTARIYGIEPDEGRVRVANRALGEQGTVICGRAPAVPPVPETADGAFMLDMMHFLTDDHLRLTLQRLHEQLSTDAPLVMRCVMPPHRQGPLGRWTDTIRNKLSRVDIHLRSAPAIRAALEQAGFVVRDVESAGRNRNMLWVCALKAPRNEGA
jgi:predicted exporter